MTAGPFFAAFLGTLLLPLLAVAVWSVIFKILRAREIQPEEAPEIYEIVLKISQLSGIRRPRLYVLPNAYPDLISVGLGPGLSFILLSRGLVELLNREEFTGVLFREAARIQSPRLAAGTLAAAIGACLTAVPVLLRGIFNAGSFQLSCRHDNLLVWCLDQSAKGVSRILVFCLDSFWGTARLDDYSAQACGSPFYLMSALKKIDSARASLTASLPDFLTHLSVLPKRGRSFWGAGQSFSSRMSRLEAHAAGN